MGISWWWLNEFDAAMLALVLAAALRWGAGPERLCVAVLVGMEAVDRLDHVVGGNEGGDGVPQEQDGLGEGALRPLLVRRAVEIGL